MNLKCLICSDILTSYADIYTTPCGHLFHFVCLTQWLERSSTCPQCRYKSTEKSIHKIFLSVEEASNASDLATIQFQLENTQFQLKLKESEVKKVQEKYDTACAQTLGLREEVKEQENKIRVLDSAMHALKGQVIYFKSKVKESDRLEEQIVKLRDKLKEMEHVQLIIAGSQEQANDMLRNNRDPQSLSLLVTTLKKELIESDRKRKKMQVLLKEVQGEAQISKKELAVVTKRNQILQQETELHKSCESERRYLKQKIEELKTTVVKGKSSSENDADISLGNNSIKRILSESPAPFSKFLKIQDNRDSDEANVTLSPSVSEKVQQIKDSDSPYLQVQVSSVGLSGLMKYNKFKSRPLLQTHTKSSLFKNASLSSLDSKGAQATESYDGLGGHAKDEVYPTPRPKTGIKRHKTTSSISMKFRKLAPHSQTKLNNFLSDQQDDNT